MQVIIQIVGYKNVGKTTLIESFIKYFTEKGYKVGAIKHDGHDFQIDKPYTDTWRFNQAGAEIIAITSQHRSAVFFDYSFNLSTLLNKFGHLDLLLVEGFKQEDYPKFVLLKDRSEIALLKELNQVIACVCWEEIDKQSVPTFSISDKKGICDFILSYMNSLEDCNE